MEQFTAIEWLIEQLYKHQYHINILDVAELNGYFKQAKALEYTAQDVKEAYNAGYTDRECNHISDANNYIHDLSYIKIQQQNKIIKDYEEHEKSNQNNPRRRRRLD